MTTIVDKNKNLEHIRRFDAFASEVIEHCAHAALFNFSLDTKEWLKTEVDGSLFIYKRVDEPLYSLMIVNDQSTKNFVEPITDGLQLRYESPYISIHRENGCVRGVWVYDEDDCKRMFNTLLRLCKQSNEDMMFNQYKQINEIKQSKEDMQSNEVEQSSEDKKFNDDEQSNETKQSSENKQFNDDEQSDEINQSNEDNPFNRLDNIVSVSPPSYHDVGPQPRPERPKWALMNGNSSIDSMRGLCGLQNLGNTCFMNSAIQCLSNVPELTNYFLEDKYVDEINADNPLGTHGHLVKEYADLLKDMWSGQCTSVRPTELKRTIGHFAPRFTGHAQHDSQELTSFLLDGLHEDLNRIKHKPYVEEKELDGQDEVQAAQQAWADYRKRNDSIIVDLLHGQHKSTLTCNVCDKISIKFEPFCYLSVPVPTKEQKAYSTVFFMRVEKWAKFYVTHTSKTTVRQLKHMLREQLQLPSNIQVVIFSSNSGQMLTDDKLLPYSSYAYNYHYNTKLYAHAVEPGPVVLVENHFTSAFCAPLLLPHPAKLTRRAMLDELVPRVRELCLPPATAAGHATTADNNNEQQPTTSAAATNTSAASSSSCSALMLVAPPPSPMLSSASSSLSPSSSAVTSTPVASGSSASFSSSTLSPSGSFGGGRAAGLRSSGGSSPTIKVLKAVTVPVTPSSSSSSSSSSADGSIFIAGGVRVAAAVTAASANGGNGMLMCDDGVVVASPLTPSAVANESSLLNNSHQKRHDDTDNTETMMDTMDTADDDDIGGQTPRKASPPPPPIVLPTPTVIELVDNQTHQMMAFPEDMDEEMVLQCDDNDLGTAEGPPFTVKLFWDSSLRSRFAQEELNQLVEREVNMTSAMKKCYTLKECIDMYTQQEQLNEEDSWYCPNCKMHRRAFKKLDLWTLPQILVIHLKRFIYSRYTRDKIETELEIPIRGMDLADKVLNPAHSQEKYDLIGISNHSGGLGSGHYTACALNGEQWCEFNDSSAYRLSVDVPDVLASREAYMLFYRRRDEQPQQLQ